MKADIERFITKYGYDNYLIFTKYKDRVKNLGLSTDYTYHLKHTDNVAMEKYIRFITDYFTPTHKRDVELAKKLADYKYYGEDNGYKVYELFNGYACFLLAPNTTWCISGSFKAKTQNDMKLDLARGYFLGEKYWSGYKNPPYSMILFVSTKNENEKYLFRFLKENQTLDLYKHNEPDSPMDSLKRDLPYHLIPQFKNMSVDDIYRAYTDKLTDFNVKKMEDLESKQEQALKEGKPFNYYYKKNERIDKLINKAFMLANLNEN